MSVFSHPDFDAHERIVFGHDPETGLRAIIAVHNTRRGPALGGCRMHPYAGEADALRDVLRLSRGMTYKSAMADLPLGGGKSVIIGDPAKHKSASLFHALGRMVEELSGRYIVGQDSGIAAADLKAMSTETDYVAGGEDILDDDGVTHSGNPSPATALGVLAGIEACVKHRLGRDDLHGIRVAIQGVGSVGLRLAELLAKRGARLFVTDVNPANLTRAVNELGAETVDGDLIHALDVDVFAPCALGGAINDDTIDALRAPIIAGCANNQLARPEHAGTLHRRGILYAPDYVINAGGLISLHYLRQRSGWRAAMRHIKRIGDTLSRIYRHADANDQNTAAVADQMAERRFRRPDEDDAKIAIS